MTYPSLKDMGLYRNVLYQNFNVDAFPNYYGRYS